MQNFEDIDFAWSLEDIGAYYREYERLMVHWYQTVFMELQTKLKDPRRGGGLERIPKH